MKKLLNVSVAVLITVMVWCCDVSAQVCFGDASLFNDGWLFSLTDADGYSKAEFDDSQWRGLALPHDWSVEYEPSRDLASCTGFLPGGIGWYRKHFTVSDSYSRHYIYFEGVYNRSEVYLNGHLLGKRPNGYVSFMYEMTEYLKNGDNVLSVRVDHSRYADSRWYTGSGIYRDVYIIGCGDEHLSQWGVTYSYFGKGEILVTAPAEGDDGSLVRRVILRDAEGREVARAEGVGEKHRLVLSDVKLWSVNAPYLYLMSVELMKKGSIIDRTTVRVGLRTLSFDADRGFALNGESMKVKGVCLHHDAGVFGSAVPEDVLRRRLLTLKDMGCNAIRMSHNPQAPLLYDLCDEMGFLVMDEGSDEWEFPKRKWIKGWNKGEPGYDGTYDFFEEWIERDVTDMVRRDRNHPCVFLWSVGNEVDYPNDPYSHPVLDGKNSAINQPMFGGYKPDAPNAERIGVIAKRLARCIRSVDETRPVTGALAGVVMSNQTEYPAAVDVVGYNYTENRYAEDHKTYPDRILYGSETSTNLAAWKAVRDNDYIFGQFVWTGIDYLGESGAWPSRGLGTGLVDFAGFLKPRGWFFKSLWSEQPMAYLGTYPKRGDRYSTDAGDVWNYSDGQIVRVVCYTNCASARLLLNGEEVGAKKMYDDGRGMIAWDVAYHPGRLAVEAFDELGNKAADYTVNTAGSVSELVVKDITVDGGQPVRQILVEAVDKDGNRVKYADGMVDCTASGTTHILGIESGSNSDMSHPRSMSRKLYMGCAVVYITGGIDGLNCSLRDGR